MHSHQSFHFQNSRGLKYQYFFEKIDVKLPFTIKNKRSNTNFKFEFQNYFIFTPNKHIFGFWRKTPKNTFSLCFGSDLALKAMNTQLLFCSVFLKTHLKKVNNHQKHHFGHFKKLITFFHAFLKILTKRTFSIVSKPKT